MRVLERYVALNKIVWDATGHLWLAFPGCRVELLEQVLHVLIDLKDRSLVSAPVTIVWCTKDGHYIPIVAPAVALHHKLVGTGDEGEVVAVVEGL